MSRHLLVLGSDPDDVLDFVISDPLLLAHRRQGAHVCLVWPTAFDRIRDSDPFDDLFLTNAIVGHPEQLLRENWIAACRTRLRGPDGRTPGERLHALGGGA